MITQQPITEEERTRMLNFLRNEEVLNNMLFDIIDKIKADHLKIKVDKNVIDKIKNEENEKYLNSLKSYIDGDRLIFDIRIKDRLYFIPIFNIPRNIINSLIKHGFLTNIMYAFYMDVNNAEARNMLLIKRSLHGNFPPEIDLLLLSNNIYKEIQNIFCPELPLDVVKKTVVSVIHGADIDSFNVNEEFKKFLTLFVNDIDIPFVKISQLFNIHYITMALKNDEIIWFLNYDGGYIIRLKK